VAGYGVVVHCCSCSWLKYGVGYGVVVHCCSCSWLGITRTGGPNPVEAHHPLLESWIAYIWLGVELQCFIVKLHRSALMHKNVNSDETLLRHI
jgi:hypothetical protein